MNYRAYDMHFQAFLIPAIRLKLRKGLRSSDETDMVYHCLRGPTPPQAVRRYELAADGNKYFQQIPGTFGQTEGFCYEQKTVDSIVKWTESQGSRSQAEATYIYKLENLAVWANDSDVQ